jgi:hypothetical protein
MLLSASHSTARFTLRNRRETSRNIRESGAYGGAVEDEGEILVQDFFQYAASSSEIIRIDREKYTLLAKSMNTPKERLVLVQVEPEAMAATCCTVEGFSLSRLKSDEEYRVSF